MASPIRSPRLVLALLTALNLLNYLDRYIVAVVVSPIENDLGLSHFVAGLLPSAFLVSYFVTSPVFGRLADHGGRWGGLGPRRVLMALGVAAWSLATVGSGLAQGATSMLATRMLVGIGEASYATIAPTIIDDIAPTSQKSAWMAIYSAATPIGSALGFILGGFILHAYGWRAAFFVAGGPGLLAACLCLFIADPPRGAPSTLGLAAAARALAAVPLYRNLVLGYCAYTFAMGGLAFWAPAYVTLRYGMTAGRAAFLFGIVTVLGGAAGTFLGGYLADRASRDRLVRLGTRDSAPAERRPDAVGPSEAPGGQGSRGEDDAIARANVWVTGVACGIGAPLALAAILAPTTDSFFALTFPCQVALFIMSGPINVAILRAAPQALRASAMAVCIFAIHALGDFWSTPLIGFVADRASMQTALYIVPLAFAAAAFVWWRAADASARLT